MAGTINSLGLGSGVLTSDLIDKLRKNEESAIIAPIDKKIASNKLKQTSFDLLNSLMKTFQASVSKLSSDTLFLNRTVNGNNDALNVAASAGSDVQSFSISDIVTAKADVYHSATQTSKTTPLDPTGGQLTLAIGTNSFAIDYTSTTSLQDLATAINDKAGANVTASVLQVGTDKYELMLKSDSVGANQKITLSDSGTLLGTLGMINNQPAADASFKYNNVAITRPSNEITDLINGVTISLKQDQTPGTQTAINITQDKTEVSTEMSLLVQNYNTLITNIKDMTAYDKAAGKVGVFNGDNFIKSISRDINRVITSIDANGKSLMDYGISLDRNGVMSLDSAAFDAKMAADPKGVESVFSGTVVNGTVQGGIFDTLYDQMKNFTGYQKDLGNYQENLTKTLDKLNKDHDTMVARIDARYEILSKRFMAYDSMISKFNNQFASLQQQINAANNSN